MGRGRLIVAVLAGAALSATPSASADVIAAVDVPLAISPTQQTDQFDIALLNATTGVKFSLPAGVNTPNADEFHPSITPDGRWLAFERTDPIAGTTRIITANLTTSQTADLFNAFDVGALHPATPFVEADGSAVLTGTPFSTEPQWTQTSLSGFPNPPFTHTQTQLPIVEQGGQTFDPIDTSFASAATVVNGSNGTEAVVVHRSLADGASDTVFIGNGFDQSASIGFAHPAISDPTTDVEVMEHRSQGACIGTGTNACAVAGQLGFLAGGVAAKPTALPAIVNALGADEAFPAFTPDGRYLGFVRQAGTRDRLFVFDTVTQTLLNDQGVVLGILETPFSARDHLRRLEGNLSLRQTPVFTAQFQLALNGQLQFHLLTSTIVGLLVQRIVGHHKLFGHTVRTLKTIGRVPLGRFARGKHALHWNLRVAGHRLAPGTYLVTPRSLTRGRIVTGLGKPHVLKIRH